ncbi:MAG: phosphotransferase, partial [Paludibacteraceae bacterium]|nr:phosphotransferase [Paludibacteraceae bacterium]
YVFDCRALHNPGRYEPYKKLTGRDASVIKFIEESPTVAEFLKSVYAIADISVSKYIERGFKNLQFSFGCTGGQHRSVYGAEHLATYLKQKYGDEIIVDLIHREQKIREIK